MVWTCWWCCSHLVWLVCEGFIPARACFCSENFFVTCSSWLFCCCLFLGIVRKKRGGRGGHAREICMVCKVQKPYTYSGKFSRGPIFAERWSSNISRSNFHGSKYKACGFMSLCAGFIIPIDSYTAVSWFRSYYSLSNCYCNGVLRLGTMWPLWGQSFWMNPVVVHVNWEQLWANAVSAGASSTTGVLNEVTVDSLLLASLK